jgi:hypothetical protein
MIEAPCVLEVYEINENTVRMILQSEEVKSIIGHKATAEFLTKKIGREINYNRESVKIKTNDTIIVFQILTRLEEGKVLSEIELKSIPMKIFTVFVHPVSRLEK